LEITFKRENVVSKKIFFDEMMGSGTGMVLEKRRNF
jgi:hypothetical protein